MNIFGYVVLIIISILFTVLLAIGFDNKLSYFIILFVPLLLFSTSFYLKTDMRVSKRLGWLFLTFMLISFISFIFSINKQVAFENIVLYGSLFLWHIWAYNYRAFLRPFIAIFLYLVGGLLIIYALLIPFFLYKSWLFLIPTSSINLVYPVQPGHNHLGDFLIIPISILLYQLMNAKTRLIKITMVGIGLVFVFFSYSRSAYISVLIVSILTYLFRSKIPAQGILLKKLITLFVVISFIFAVLVSTKDLAVKTSTTQWIYDNLYYNFDLRPKTLISNRVIYITQGLRSLKHNFLLGSGLGNFKLLSLRYRNTPSDLTTSSHNVFADMLFEGGVFVWLTFLLIALTLLKNNYKSPYFFAICSILINFSFDYSYKIYPILAVFFILSAIHQKVHDEASLSKGLLINTACIPALFLLSMLASDLSYMARQYKLAWLMYPLNPKVYTAMYEQGFKEGTYKTGLDKGRFYLTLYGKLFKGDSEVMIYIGNMYLIRYNEEDKALYFLKKAYEWNNYQSVELIKAVYGLEKKINGADSAQEFIVRYFSRISSIKTDTSFSNKIKKDAHLFCNEIFYKCPFVINYNK